MEMSSPGQSSQSARGVAATPTHGQCDMKLMRKHVVNRLSPYCTVVCEHLGYSTAELRGDNKKNLIAMLEDWITTGGPKTWSVFIGVLSNISELSVVTSEICSELNKVGVHVVQPAMVQDNTSSLTYITDGGTNQSATGVTVTPTQSLCNIKIMHKCVVNKLTPYYNLVCHHLGYSATKFKRENNKKNLIALLEDWITTGEKEGRPKTWSMFIEVLSDVNELSAVTSEIRSELNKAGVCTAPLTLRSHDPSLRNNYPQSRPAMVHDGTSSLTLVTDAPNKPSSGQSPPSSSEAPLDMKTMYKHVVSRLSPYWTTVGDYLEYSVVERNSFRAANNNKSLTALLENWISTNNGRKPKTWPTFIKVLEELDQDLKISVGSEICASLERETFSPSGHPKAPTRSASYSIPSAHQDEGHQIRSNRAFSYPKVNYPPPSTYHIQAISDVRSKLDYTDASCVPITEESSVQEPRHGQPYAAAHQPPHSFHPSIVRSPSPTATTTTTTPYSSHGQRYPGTPAPRTTATRPPPGQYPPPSLPGRHQSQVPSQPSSVQQQWHNPYHSINPSEGYSSMNPSQPSMNPSLTSQGYPSVNTLQGSPSVNLSQGYLSSQGYPSMDFYSLQQPRYRSFHPRARLHATQRPPAVHPQQRMQFQPAQSTSPQSLPRQQTPPQGLQLQQQTQPLYTQGQGGKQRHDPHVQGSHRAQGPQQLPRATREQQQTQQQRHYDQLSLMHYYQQNQQSHDQTMQQKQQHSLQTQRGQQPHPSAQYHQMLQSGGLTMEQHNIQIQQRNIPTQRQHNIRTQQQRHHPPVQQEQHYQQWSHGQTMEQQHNIQTQPQRHTQDQHYQQTSHGQVMEQQGNKQPMPQQQQMTSIPHHGMVDNTLTEQYPQQETLREEERGQGFISEGVTTMTDPAAGVGNKDQLKLQDHLAKGVADPHHDHTDYHITSYDTTRSPTCVTVTMTIPTMSTVTSNTSVMSTATHSSRVVDNTSLITAATPVTSPTATNRTSSTGSSVTSPTGATATGTKTSGGQFNVLPHTTATNSSTPSTPQLQVNSDIIQTSINGVEQTTSMNQSTGNPTASSTTNPTVPAPFKWKKGKMLGRGAFGEVFQCMDEDNDRRLAVKEVWIDPNFSSETRKAVESLEREIQLLQTIKHDRIVQYYGTERTETSVRIFMEYMPGGSLYHHIDLYGVLKEHVASKYTRQLLEGVEYLHARKIVHRDIKGANILMDLYGHVKIADFGASKLLRSIYLSSRTHKTRNNTQKSVAGTAYWMAPEVIRGETVNYKADIWSLGCTVVEMLTHYPPYHHLEPFPAMYKIAVEPMSVDLPSECSEHAQDFLCQCFTSIVTERPGASVLLEHLFIKTGIRPSSSTVQGSPVTTPSSQVTSSTITISHTTDTQVTTDGSSRVAEPTAGSNQLSSSDSNDDDTIDDDTSDDHVAADEEDIDALKQSFANMKPPSVPAEQQQQQQQQTTSSNDVHSNNKTEPQSDAATTPTIVPTTATATATATATNIPTTAGRNGTDRIAPDHLQLKQIPQSPTTNGSSTNGSASASNVHDNSAPSKPLPEKAISNTCMKDLALWKNRQQHVQAAYHAFANNLFGNFPGSSETPLVVQMFVMQDSKITISPTGPTSLPIIDHKEIGHNSLEPFAYEICNSVDISTILPFLIKHGLINRHDNEYFMNPVHTSVEKQCKLTTLVVSLNEDCVDKFVDCLSQTSDFAPHDTLLKTIQSSRKKKESHH